MQENNEQQPATIQKVHLKGYKSIRDLTVELKAGLNIIIGANGSGKTNFLEFLDAVSKMDFHRILNGSGFQANFHLEKGEVSFTGEKRIKTNARSFPYQVKKEYTGFKLTYYLSGDKKIISTDGDLEFSSAHVPNTNYTTFHNPISSILNDKLSVVLSHHANDLGENPDRETLFTSYLKNNTKTFLDIIFSSEDWSFDNIEAYSKRFFNNKVFNYNNLINNLKNFTLITDFKINLDLTRQSKFEEEGSFEYILIEGIDFQFQVNNEWLNWTQLSDGTKRLFYLIGSVTYAQNDEVVLIEEPELGVHPHQLSQLMNFLKEQSQEKQIIITTHAPQVLNCLKEDELDCIIVARHEGKAGTQMYHLSEEEKGYVSDYMKNQAFLSDYWTMSGFINEEPTHTL